MIFAHSIVGIIAGNYFGYFWYWFLGSIIPDIDHLWMLYKHRIFSVSKIIDSMRFEEKYELNYKTKYIHSIFGAIVLSAPVFLISTTEGFYFFTAYLGHLLLDLPDKDIKYYLYPLKIKFSGFLPIWSYPERIFTIFLLILMIFSFYF